jgi:hypothetical protein
MAASRAGGVRASVGPQELPWSDPLALLERTSSVLRFDFYVFGLSIIEHKPGLIATAYGMLADFIRAVKGEGHDRLELMSHLAWKGGVPAHCAGVANEFGLPAPSIHGSQ